MARSLDVYLHDDLVGRLTQDDHGQMGFAYEHESIGKPSALPLSQSLPLREEPFGRNECRGFFGGILPEESQREIIAKNLGVSAKNDFALLEKIGGECAGAVTFVPSGMAPPDLPSGYRDLTTVELERALKELPRRPLLAGEEGIRLSLAGAQNKLAVRVSNAGISIPLGQAPSTHILKPASPHFDGFIDNEAFCLGLAKAVGLNAATATVGNAGDVSYLLIERYDRIHAAGADGGDSVTRLHQEDFCQALGIPSDLKYQNEGGPSLKKCFDLLRSASSVPARDLLHLFDAAIFNYLIGNHDAHGKNFSLLYVLGADGRTQTRLAPLYDLICTLAYPDLSKKMAMKIGGEYEPRKIGPPSFDKLAGEAGFTQRLSSERVPVLASRILAQLPALEAQYSKSAPVAQLVREASEKMSRAYSAIR